jgi:hypothetical protein
MPRTVAVDVAKRAAPELTGLTQDAFSAGQNVYGGARPPGVDGEPLSLKKTGATEQQLRFVQIGTVVRCVLGPKYARYLIRYGILPNGAIPVGWTRKLNDLVKATEVKL